MTTTPLMQQYWRIKQQHPDVLLLFQVGDFYELFFDDAKIAASLLGIALTKRGTHQGEPIPLCGVPVHALDMYLGKLVKAGHKVALCDQLQQAVPGKLVDRGITQILTPGTLTDLKLLDAKSSSYLAVLASFRGSWAIVFAELLTAHLYVTVVPATNAERQLETELLRFFPDEIVVSAEEQTTSVTLWLKRQGYYVTHQSPHEQDQAVHTWLEQQFGQEQATTVMHQVAVYHAFSMLYHYLNKTQTRALHQFNDIQWYEAEAYVMLDAATQKNLEIVHNANTDSTAHTLFNVLDHAITPMGSRCIKQWLVRPLRTRSMIEQRHEVVAFLMHDLARAHELRQLLRGMGDVERVVGRIALQRGQLHDYLHLMRCLRTVPTLKTVLAQATLCSLAQGMYEQLGDFSPLHNLLARALNDDQARDWVIKTGYDATLDRMRTLIDNSHQQLMALEQKEQHATGVSSLKVRYNSVTGYYIEITKANLHAVPPHYIRLQTLLGKERFITPELRALQDEIEEARTSISQQEQALFDHIKQALVPYISDMRRLAHYLGVLDALLSFAHVAATYNYVRPSFNDERVISIVEGRHPVVEHALGSKFIPNDTLLDDVRSSWLITGPNMGGKSTYLRQVAHICILAQMGSFVPARQASLPLLDRIFTRIGSGDHVAGGKSTFLVEMEETAHICLQATKDSLAIFDEIGRGTSTFDGMAIAQAVVEYVHTVIGARCLFATHYHELTALEQTMPGIVCYYTASKKTAHGILFLHKIVSGTAPGSFGLEVARLAQLPATIIARAAQLLQELEAGAHTSLPPSSSVKVSAEQQDVMVRYQQLVQQIQALNTDLLTPKQAFDLVWQLKEQMPLDN